MRTYFWFVILLLAVLIGCSRQHAPLQNSTSSIGLFITNYGRFEAEGGLLTVSVSESDGKLEIVRSEHFDHLAVTNPATGEVSVCDNASITNSQSSDGWEAQPGWFVFVENQRRVWSYDGDLFLWLLQMEPGVGSGSYGPKVFPCKVPEAVLSRLPTIARNQIREPQ